MPSQLITVPLNDLLEALLPRDDPNNKHETYNRPLPKDLGLILAGFLTDRLDYKIALTNFDGIELKYPVLWHYDDWFNSNARYQHTKEEDRKQRVAGWIKQANIDNLTRAIIKSNGLDETFAKQTAINLLNKGAGMEVLSFFGLKKLVTKESEL